MFVPPEVYDFRITEQNADKWAEFIGEHIIDNRRRPVFDWQKETVQQLGRWQPWHAGHRALFERAIAKTGQVVIQIRDCQGWNNSNPFEVEKVKSFIFSPKDTWFFNLPDSDPAKYSWKVGIEHRWQNTSDKHKNLTHDNNTPEMFHGFKSMSSKNYLLGN
jgi:hypothetical protein